MTGILLGAGGLALILLAALTGSQRFGLPVVVIALVGVIMAGHWLGV